VTGNYKDVAATPVADEIKKADPTGAVRGELVVFDGSVHRATGSCVGVDGHTGLSGLDLTGTTHTHAGTYADSWTFTDVTGNYKDVAATPVADEIKNADPSCSVGGYSVVFDGSAHTATGSCVGVDGHTGLSGLDL